MIDRPLHIQEDVILAPYTTFKIGGKADYFSIVSSEEELEVSLDWAIKLELPIMILGGGSNVVFADTGFRGLVLHINIKGVKIKKNSQAILVTAAAGEEWDEFVAKMIESKISGLENLSGIPGKVGASPIQNIGAYGIEVGEKIFSVRAYDYKNKKYKNFSSKECRFSYRDSFFKTEEGKNFVITAVTFKLNKIFSPVILYPDLKNYFKEIAPTLFGVREAVIEIRKGKFPDLSLIGTAGSFFKNPIITNAQYEQLILIFPELPSHPHGDCVKISAAWLIDNVANAKGKVVGNVGTYNTQALVFVNNGGATADELDTFAKKISDTIFELTKIELEREVGFVGCE